MTLGAAQSGPQRRITQAIDETQLVRLAGNTHPLARPENDLGPAPADLALEHMFLVLQPSAPQQAALQDLLVNQQALGSPQYHQWLTPEAFASRFGAASDDVATLTSWLGSHGFSVEQIARGGTMIEFSGSAAQVQNALHTEIHRYSVQGRSYWANNADPEIPAALAGVVAGVDSLNNFPRHSNLRRAGQGQSQKSVNGAPVPALTFPCSSNSSASNYYPGCSGGVAHALVPGDFATIYNVLPLYTASTPITGMGQTIAVVGRVDINLNDVANFRSLLLPGYPHTTSGPTPAACASGVQTCMIVNGPDPGIWDENEETEADLDVEWAGSIAPNATVDFVSSAGTDATDGIDLSAQYIVDHNLAPVMTSSFGLCEAELGQGGNAFYSILYEQAAAQGISVVVAAGDEGSEACDQDDSNTTIAEYGLGVNGLASTPYNVAAGGTMFNDNSGSSTYWNNTTSNTAPYSSAKSYIPEQAWNESCTVAACGGYLAAGGGGVSQVYAKPSWQQYPGLTGMPADGARDMPDISLASAGYDGYVLCQSDQGATCSGSQFQFEVVGGTSAAAPSFASILALVNQKTGAIQGVADVYLYGLAAKETYSSCASGSGASTCVFNDVKTGSNAVPCVSGSPDCSSTGATATAGATTSIGTSDTYSPACGEAATGATAYSAGVGYDCATGLGSINVANLINGWSSVAQTATTTSLSLTPTTMTHGAAVTATVSVACAAGPGGCPASGITGNVALLAQNTAVVESIDNATLSNGTVQWTLPGTNDVSALPGGTYNVVARYAGNTSLASSTSAPQQVVVAPENSVTEVYTGAQFDSTTGLLIPATSVPYGTYVYLKAYVCNNGGPSGSGGCTDNDGFVTGTVTFLDNGSGVAGLTGTNNVVTLVADTYSTAVEPQVYPPDSAFVQAPLLLAVGSHALTGSYSGDNSFRASTSSPFALTVTRALTKTTITNDTLSGSSTTLVAEVDTSSVGAKPSGTVTFYSGTTQLGSPVTVTGSYIVATGYDDATASLTATLPGGSDSITAVYSGDANYQTSTSAVASVTIPISVNVGPTSLSFAAQAVGSTSAPQSVTLSNGAGSASLTIASVSTSGDFVQTNNCGSTLAGGAACAISVNFVPTAAGTRTGALTITDNSIGGSQTVALSGTGTAPVVSLAPGSLIFGNQNVGTTSTAQAVTVNNTGAAILNISSIAASGDFAQTNACGTGVAAGASCQVSVTFTPTTIGSRTGALTISDNAGGGSQTVALSGTGTAPMVSLTASSLTFGNQNVGTTSAAQAVTLSNTGAAILNISSIAASGDFAQTNTCGTGVAAGASCQVSVTFTPTTTGSRTGALTITDNASNSPQAVSLSGTGISYALTVAPATLMFGGQFTGTLGLPQSVTVTNTGSQPIAFSGIEASSGFGVVSGCINPLPANTACSVAVFFDPATDGSVPGTLTFTDNAPSSPQTVSLSGTGEDVSITPASGSATSASVAPGTAANYSLNFAPVSGATGTFSLACTGAPTGASCTPDPSSISLNGSTAITIGVNVTTTASSQLAPPADDRQEPWLPWLLVLALAAFLALPRRRRKAAGLVLAGACLLASCGGGSTSAAVSGGGATGGSPGATPAGTYTLTLTASNGTVSRSTSLTLVVN